MYIELQQNKLCGLHDKDGDSQLLFAYSQSNYCPPISKYPVKFKVFSKNGFYHKGSNNIYFLMIVKLNNIT